MSDTKRDWERESPLEKAERLERENRQLREEIARLKAQLAQRTRAGMSSKLKDALRE